MITGLVVWVAGIPTVLALVILRLRARASIWRILGILFLVTYSFWIASVAFFPMRILHSPLEHPGGIESLSINLVPLRELLRSFSYLSRDQIIHEHGGNFILLMPFTLLMPALWPRLRSWKWALFAGLGISVAIESIQLGFSVLLGYGYRSVDIDDVIVNTAGALVGYALFLAATRLLRVHRRRRVEDSTHVSGEDPG